MSEEEIMARIVVYDERHQNAPWRNHLARDLNWIMGRVEYIIGMTTADWTDFAFATAAVRVVERVAATEAVKIKPKEKKSDNQPQ